MNCVLALDQQRNITGGSTEKLRDAIKRGADLRIYTEFRHNEHVDMSSNNNEIVREVSDFPATYLIDDRWAAGIMTLRQPVELPGEFGPRPSMSFFMYNENGNQGVARPFLDGQGYIPHAEPNPVIEEGKECVDAMNGLMHYYSFPDQDTAAPSINFIYDFYSYRYLVDDAWEEVLSHDAEGNVISGSAQALDEASNEGLEFKVAIEGICRGLHGEENNIKHELIIQTGPHYYYSETGYMVTETRPFVRVRPTIPMKYDTKNWDFGWAIVRSDGYVAGLFYDPYTLKPFRTYSRHAMRWFVRRK